MDLILRKRRLHSVNLQIWEQLWRRLGLVLKPDGAFIGKVEFREDPVVYEFTTECEAGLR